jgi:hypothetical protein
MKKTKPCEGSCEGEARIIWKKHEGKRYCKDCWNNLSRIQKPKPTRKRIPSRSPKKIERDKEYSKLRIKFLDKYPMCHAHLYCCGKLSTDVHHMAGRIGDNYLDITKWLPVCRPCHTWIEEHPKEAREMGLSLTKH